MSLKRLLLVILCSQLSFPVSCNFSSEQDKKSANCSENMLQKVAPVKLTDKVYLSSITTKIIEAPNNTFGYQIEANGKALIRQTNIPGQSGNNGFTDSVTAQRVADHVANKIKNNKLPPTLSKFEIDSLLLKK